MLKQVIELAKPIKCAAQNVVATSNANPTAFIYATLIGFDGSMGGATLRLRHTQHGDFERPAQPKSLKNILSLF